MFFLSDLGIKEYPGPDILLFPGLTENYFRIIFRTPEPWSLSAVNNLNTRTLLSYVRWLSVVVACILGEMTDGPFHFFHLFEREHLLFYSFTCCRGSYTEDESALVEPPAQHE
jgi:hypothetical protein